MVQPVNSGRTLIEEIDGTITPSPTLWWLGHSGFILRFATITFYIDPWLSMRADRRVAAPLDPAEIRHADMILATHAGHLDAPAVSTMLENSKNAKLVLPKSSAEKAHATGIAYTRMTTTDADLRVEYFKNNLYGRIYAVPSHLDWTAKSGYPYLGYLIRFGKWTVYHAGNCVFYDGLAERLRRFNVSVALLPIGQGNFSVAEAAQLGAHIGAGWIVPMHYGTFGEDRGEENDFIAHMLGHRPDQPFKVFQCGERWTVPED
jgi:L-ascorbate 6-phosphate lactonase